MGVDGSRVVIVINMLPTGPTNHTSHCTVINMHEKLYGVRAHPRFRMWVEIRLQNFYHLIIYGKW